MPLPTQQRLNDHLIRWNREIEEFDQAVHAAGEKRADLEYRRAVVKETARAEDPKAAGIRLETLADADEIGYGLNREYRFVEATADAKRQRLKWCGSVADALRSEIASDRQERQLYADHGGDA